MRTDKELATIKDMRAILDYFENNPTVPMPRYYRVDVFPPEADKKEVADLARTISPCKKGVVGSYYILSKTFGNITLDINFSREDVCERVVVGSEFIEEKVIPAHTKDVYEWVCPDSLLRSDEEVSVG